MSFDTPAGTRGTRMRGPSGPAGRWIQQRMMKQHRKNWKFMGMDLLFLTTIGRRTGEERVNPVAWFPGEDGTWLIVASAGGAAQHPAWYKNLAAAPDRVQIELAEGKIAVTAEPVTGAERERAWARITAAQPRYAKYEQKTDRQLPVIRLTRKAD